MIICYVGNFAPRTPRGEPFSTESHIAATLEAMGHEVVRLQENRVTAAEALRRTVDERADLFLWTKTGDWLKGDAAEMLGLMPCPSVSYHLDLFAPLPRGQDIASSPWWHTDFVFSADGDPGSEEFFKAHGVRHFWLPPGVYGPECVMAEPRDDLRQDVIFVGSGANGYHPEWPYRKQLIDWLRATYGSRFTLYGRGGDREWIRGSELNELYASAKVVVGDSLCLGFKHKRYWSDRVPETLGRGGFLIHPWIDGLSGGYTDGADLRMYSYGDFHGLQRLIDYYIQHDDARDVMRRTGHERVKREHTYAHRLTELLRVVKERA